MNNNFAMCGCTEQLVFLCNRHGDDLKSSLRCLIHCDTHFIPFVRNKVPFLFFINHFSLFKDFCRQSFQYVSSSSRLSFCVHHSACPVVVRRLAFCLCYYVFVSYYCAFNRHKKKQKKTI